MFVKSFNSAPHVICLYAMNNMEGILRDLREVKYDDCNPRLALTFRVWSLDVTPLTQMARQSDDGPFTATVE